MKIAIVSFCAVLVLYAAARFFSDDPDAPASPPALATTPAQAPKKAAVKAAVEAEPAAAEQQQPPPPPAESIETNEERFERRAAELKQLKAEFPERNYVLESSILNAEIALAEKPKNRPNLRPDEKALMKELFPLIKAGNENAKDQFLAAIDENSSPAMYFAAGNLFAENGDLPTAIDFYRTALDTEIDLPEPMKARINKNLGIMLVRQGDHEHSRSYLQQAIYLSKEPSTTEHGLLALSELNTGNLDAAEYHYKKALELDPDIRDWQIGLAKTLLNKEKYQKAIDLMNTMKANPAPSKASD